MNAGALSSILAAKKKAVESLEFGLKHRFPPQCAVLRFEKIPFFRALNLSMENPMSFGRRKGP